MSMTTNTQTPSGGIVNHAVGHIVTDAVAAAAATFYPGFLPRKIHFVNLTDRITDDWFENMAEDSLAAAIKGITAKLDADAGVTATDYEALWGSPAATITGLKAAIAGLTAKLDAGAGVTDTDYAALWGNPGANVVALKAAIAGITAKLDADAGVTDTDYASIWNAAASITSSLHSVVAGDKTLELTNGIYVDTNPNSATYGSFTLTATTMVASKKFYWEAIG